MAGNHSQLSVNRITCIRLCAALVSTTLYLALHSAPGHTSIESVEGAVSTRQSAQPSLFDELFGTYYNGQIQYELPYPFERLAASLSNKLRGCGNHGAPPYASVLIPIGRSQQPDTVEEDAFRFPRIILGIDTESCDRRLSKDRLFLAYQERSQAIEVISYNEYRGRFEFQMVENYNQQRTPTVRYARRESCLQCHQNGAAIFPQFNWTETNFNQNIAARIGKYHQHFHGIGTDQISAKAGRLDGSTDRANLFTAYQKIWRDGCALTTRAESLECRAGVFASLLKQRLGIAGTDSEDDRIINNSKRRVSQKWRTLWPDGLPIPNPDLPNPRRAGETVHTKLSDDRDPRTTRPPRALWRPPEDMDRILQGMANSFLSQKDINRLDAKLSGLSNRSRGYRQSYQGACVFDHVKIRGDIWIDANCDVSAGDLNRSRLVAQLYSNESNIVHPTLSGLYLTDSNPGYITHASLSGTLTFHQNGISTATLSARKRYQMIRARSRAGQAMSAVEFAWDERFAEPIPGGLRYLGRVRLTLENDAHILSAAIGKMVADARTLRFDGFDNKPLRGVRLMDAFFDKLDPGQLGRLEPLSGPGSNFVVE